jgi:hypothetical protein
VDVKPSPGTRMIAQTIAVRATIDRSAPIGSAGRAGLRDSGTSSAVPSSATAAIGTLIRKIAPHQKWSSRTPPTVGPATRPAIATMLQPAIALRCSAGGKTVNRIDSVLGITSEPPTPMSARHATSCPGVVENVARSEAAPNSRSPIISTRRRP